MPLYCFFPVIGIGCFFSGLNLLFFMMSIARSVQCSISIAWAKLLWKRLVDGSFILYLLINFFVLCVSWVLQLFMRASAPVMNCLPSMLANFDVESLWKCSVMNFW